MWFVEGYNIRVSGQNSDLGLENVDEQAMEDEGGLPQVSRLVPRMLLLVRQKCCR